MNYEETFTFQNLLKAHKKVKKGKLFKREVMEFELDKSANLYSLYEELNKGTYEVSPYRTFYIYEPKKRRVDATPYKDRIVQNCLVDNYLYPLLEKRIIYDNAACRKGKGTDFARKRLREFLLEEYKKNGASFYVFIFDIHHYFESIDHDVLKKKMEKLIKDGKILSFIYNIIDSFNYEIGKGIPLGNQTSQCFALYYLDKFDRIIKEKYKIKHYSRYMDDGVVFSSDKEKLIKLKEDLKKEIRDLKLEFNDSKCAIYQIKQGVTYLGFTYRFGENGKIISKVSKKKKRRLIRHLEKHALGKESLICYRNYLRMRSSNGSLINKINRLIKSQNNSSN